MDTNPREQAGAFADAFVQVPMARSAGFPQALTDIAVAFPHAAYTSYVKERPAFSERAKA